MRGWKVWLLLVVGAFMVGCATGGIPSGQINAPYTDYATLSEGDIVHLATGRNLFTDSGAALLADAEVARSFLGGKA